jgi:hypothetical protein
VAAVAGDVDVCAIEYETGAEMVKLFLPGGRAGTEQGSGSYQQQSQILRDGVSAE